VNGLSGKLVLSPLGGRFGYSGAVDASFVSTPKYASAAFALVQLKASGGSDWLLSLEQVTVCVLTVKESTEATAGGGVVVGVGLGVGDGDGDGDALGDGEGLGDADVDGRGLATGVTVFRVSSINSNTITAISSTTPAMIRPRISRRELESSVEVGVALPLTWARVGNASPVPIRSGNPADGPGAASRSVFGSSAGAENRRVGASSAGT
jgi:hypothetical protein